MSTASKDSLPSKREILRFLSREAYRPLKAKELAKALKVPQQIYRDFRNRLRDLEGEGHVYRVKGGRYALPKQLNLVVGHVDMIKSGAAFVIPEAGGEDVFISSSNLETALQGDKVVVRVEGRRRKGNPEGSIIKILERARHRFVGSFERSRHFGFVCPHDRRIHRDIYVPITEAAGAKQGEQVVVEVTDWGTTHKNPEGRITEILGKPGDPGLDVLILLKEYDLPTEFPGAVEAEAAALPNTIPDGEITRRRDLRDLSTFTIDPVDAKDFDDALSLERVGEDQFRVGIHIADVTWYISPGSRLDREALERATSVYLVDRAVPMLPEMLSNQLCSLRPLEDRLSFSVFLTLDGQAQVQGVEFAESVIHSRHRFTYEEAQELLEGEPSRASRYGELGESLWRLRSLARALYRRRADRGGLDFDLPEARVILNPEGFPEDIQKISRLDSHRIVEEFMILANEMVARRLQEAGWPALYRVHEQPDRAKFEALAQFVAVFGHALNWDEGTISPKALQRLLEQVEGRVEEAVVSTLVLRSLKRAWYSPQNVGHFGLASSAYTHFTSPIRRYPDIVVHRALKAVMAGQPLPSDEEPAPEALHSLGVHCSERGWLADEAERDSITLKKVEFMERHLGDDFWGTISGVTSYGFFVLLDDYFVEGLVHVNDLQDDYYRFLEEEYALVGQNRGRRFRLGDRLGVQVVRVNKELRQIDFLLQEET